jgi:hypothetical protein
MIEIDVIGSAAPKYPRSAILAAMVLHPLPAGNFPTYFSTSTGPSGGTK